MEYSNKENMKRLVAWVPTKLHADAAYECNIRSIPGNKYTLQDLVTDAVAEKLQRMREERVSSAFDNH